MVEYDFKQQLALGKLGEEKVFEYLNNLQDTVKVEDYSEDKIFQGYGIDGMLVEDKDNILRATFFDVKTDFNFHRTGKIFIEISQDSENEGGILSTKAELFYYYDPYGGNMFSLPIYAMRMWYKRKGISINHRTVKNVKGYETTGIIVDPFDLELDGVPIQVQKVTPLEINKLKFETT